MTLIGEDDLNRKWLRVRKELLADREYGSYNAVAMLAGEHTAKLAKENNWVRTRAQPDEQGGSLDSYLGKRRRDDDDDGSGDLEVIRYVPERRAADGVRMRRVRFEDDI